MSFATELQDLVTDLTALDEFGNSATFTWPNVAVGSAGAYGRTTGRIAAGGTAVTPLVTTIGGPVGVSPRLANGSTILISDQVIVVEASRVVTPIEVGKTRVTINSKEFSIVAMIPSRINDTDVAYRLVIR